MVMHIAHAGEDNRTGAEGRVGYVTGHFGKWHLNGHRGPGAQIWPTIHIRQVSSVLTSGSPCQTFTMSIL